MTDPANMDARARATLAKIEADSGPRLVKRFYKAATVAAVGDEWGVALDGKPLRTPGRARLTVSSRDIAGRIAGEWNSQSEHINPGAMPLTRLGISALDQVAGDAGAVRDQIADYAASDLILYRAEAPDGLVTNQRRHWDPILAWAKSVHGWKFEPVCGLIHRAQPAPALAAYRGALDAAGPLMLSAMFSITALTGSALISSALAGRALELDAAWAAAHVDEDWQISRWGRDSGAQKQRDSRHQEFRAAIFIVEHLTQTPES